MDDLLKEAIADAKAVRETALENAKLALEEAFTPRLQSMLSKKIQSEIGDEVAEDEEVEDEEEDEMEPEDEVGEDATDYARNGDEDEMESEPDEDEDEEMEEEVAETIEVNGHTYRLVGEEEEPADMEDEEEVEDDLDEYDLDEVIKELEEELEEGDENDLDESDDEELDEDTETEELEEEEVAEGDEDLDENDVSSDIGKGDNKVNKKASDTTGIGSASKAKHHESADYSVEETLTEDEDSEEIDLEEVLEALAAEDESEAVEEDATSLKTELEEHRNVIKYLRSKLSEVNLLNAKLLFTNKLFRNHGLNNDQKMKVVETFDRAKTLREVKLVYTTMAESFGTPARTEITESKGSASKPVASTVPKNKEVISEGTELKARFQKLANIV